ncbi:hypothetical protein EAI_15795 [Harpegnathos saltator]|uniref:Uncharacterized protein n=1 Tax=Harpegnathos saltator TaxID=610380 RepID=E2BBK6_HARSA|nr:hypothetical protein EAI_15795 [Harpegnathos saltator]
MILQRMAKRSTFSSLQEFPIRFHFIESHATRLSFDFVPYPFALQLELS